MGALLVLALLAAPAAASTPAPGADKDKLVCKRETPIGSLIATRKRCMTKAQWDRLGQDHNEEARRMQMEFATRPKGS